MGQDRFIYLVGGNLTPFSTGNITHYLHNKVCSSYVVDESINERVLAKTLEKTGNISQVQCIYIYILYIYLYVCMNALLMIIRNCI